MNNLVFITEARFIKDENNAIFGDPSFNYSLWERYLEAFDEMYVFARVKQDKKYKADVNYLSSGPKVHVIELPYYLGP